jgi:hypothetical protein
VIEALSPRTTALYQTLAPSSRVTSPTRRAPEATNAVADDRPTGRDGQNRGVVGDRHVADDSRCGIFTAYP